MADEQTDPLVALLDKSGLSTAQKRGLWDLYTAAKDTGDLQKRLDALKLPDAIKHDLWNLKDSEVESSSSDNTRADGTAKGGGFFGTLQRPDGRVSTELSIGVDFDGKETEIPLLVPSLSKQEVATLLALPEHAKPPKEIADKAIKYAEQRMAAGKPVFAEPSEVGKFKPLPFAFDPNRQRKDTNVIAVGSGSESETPDTFGIDPAAVAIVGNAAVTPVVGAASRVGSGVKAAAGAAGPLVKYHAVSQGLRMLGAPGWLAESAGALAAGRRGGAKAAEEAATTEATAAAETTPMGFPKPTGPQLTPLERTKQLAAEWRTSRGLPAEGYKPTVDPEVVKEEFKAFFNPPKATSAAASVPKLKVQETALAMKLLKNGLPAQEVMDTILELRKMPVSWRSLPTDAEVADLIAARNAARQP